MVLIVIIYMGKFTLSFPILTHGGQVSLCVSSQIGCPMFWEDTLLMIR